ncbi:MAG: hypothetical protein MJ170_01275 [Alphaproteobacteria bacterium]|nr:hypothetical protein [Alphaproteobacteria bacterium]
MVQNQILELANQIDRFEIHGNYEVIYFKNPKDVEGLKKMFADCGITDVVQAKATIMSGLNVDEYMVEVNYRSSEQKNIVDDLEHAHKRMKAWSILRGWGGTQMTNAEKDFFAKQDMNVAARKMQSMSRE